MKPCTAPDRQLNSSCWQISKQTKGSFPMRSLSQNNSSQGRDCSGHHDCRMVVAVHTQIVQYCQACLNCPFTPFFNQLHQWINRSLRNNSSTGIHHSFRHYSVEFHYSIFLCFSRKRIFNLFQKPRNCLKKCNFHIDWIRRSVGTREKIKFDKASSYPIFVIERDPRPEYFTKQADEMGGICFVPELLIIE
ncbi:hypothetical protein Ahy_A10g047107 isoform B [Arachis hypogaea]|uniref:Uncharacterized protein n=1 Tax=Arachis hypogaea TaxID=3818 RepID=A0A445B1N7_ARAHY|nr:hypothetical protein Ahy_A10g047107 isoform B [Arachis hypogaea]